MNGGMYKAVIVLVVFDGSRLLVVAESLECSCRPFRVMPVTLVLARRLHRASRV